MEQCSELLEAGQRIARKYRSVRRGYYPVRYGLIDEEHDPIADILSLYGLMRLEEYLTGQSFDTEAALTLLLLHGADHTNGLRSVAIGSLAGAYHYVRRHWRIPDQKQSTLLWKCVQDLMLNQPRTVSGTFCYPGERFRVDLLLYTCPFLAMAGGVLDDTRLHDEAVRQFRGLREELYDADDGLYHHARNWFRDNETTPDRWARSTACAVVALVELLQFLPEAHPEKDRLLDHLCELTDTLAKAQSDDGLYRQDLLDPTSYEETSASALIVYAMATAVNRGWISEEHQASVDRGWEGLTTKVEFQGNVNIHDTSVSVVPGRTTEHYRNAPSALNGADGFGPLVLAAGACYALKRKRQWNTRIQMPHDFDRPPEEDIKAFFSVCYEASERRYNGDGSWGRGTMDDPEGTFDEIIKESQTQHPIIRESAYCVMGFIGALKSVPDPVYAQRVKAGLEWLLANQESDGSFRLWTRREGGQVKHDGCLYDTGLASVALASGYEYSSDPKYLHASARAAEWEASYPIVANTNFNAFAVWHLARHYAISGDRSILAAAIHRVRFGMLPAQQPSGGWVGHNSMVWYHGINVRAYAALLSVLPSGHAFRHELEPALRASVNHLGTLQRPDGSLYHRPGSTEVSQNYSQVIVSLALASQVLGDVAISKILNGVLSYRMSADSGDPDLSFNQEKSVWMHGTSNSYIYAFGVYLELFGSTAIKE